jgi:hypothetical protein
MMTRMQYIPKPFQIKVKNMKTAASSYLNEWVALPDVPALKKRLEAKLVEYQKRIEKYKHDYAVASVGIVVDRDGNLMDAIYKHAIVNALLKNGKVNISALREQLKKDFKGYLLDDLFTNAVSVIDDYMTTGGAHTTGASKFFNKELFESILDESGRLDLPDDTNIKQRLRKKYHEYLGRILDYDRSTDKTLDPGAHKRDHYKVRIIEELQNKGCVDLQDVILELTGSEATGFERLEFYRASARIHELLDADYSESDTTLL